MLAEDTKIYNKIAFNDIGIRLLPVTKRHFIYLSVNERRHVRFSVSPVLLVLLWVLVVMMMIGW